MTLNKRQQVAAGGLILNKAGEILFVKRTSKDEFMPGIWEIPGGGIEFAENPIRGLAREIREECGLNVQVLPNPLTLGEYFIERDRERVHRVEFTFKCILIGDDSIVLGKEHDEYKWILPSNFSQLKMTNYMFTLVGKSLKRMSYDNN